MGKRGIRLRYRIHLPKVESLSFAYFYYLFLWSLYSRLKLRRHHTLHVVYLILAVFELWNNNFSITNGVARIVRVVFALFYTHYLIANQFMIRWWDFFFSYTSTILRSILLRHHIEQIMLGINLIIIEYNSDAEIIDDIVPLTLLKYSAVYSDVDCLTKWVVFLGSTWVGHVFANYTHLTSIAFSCQEPFFISWVIQCTCTGCKFLFKITFTLLYFRIGKGCIRYWLIGVSHVSQTEAHCPVKVSTIFHC